MKNPGSQSSDLDTLNLSTPLFQPIYFCPQFAVVNVPTPRQRD